MEIGGTTALITGGASGLGEACVRHFIGKGGKAAILDVAEETGSALVDKLGSSVIFCKTDVTDEASVQAAVDQAMDAFGAIHVVINCAGVGTPAKVVGKEGPMPLEMFTRVVNINLIGTFNVIRLAAPKIMANDPNDNNERGVIVNTASVAAFEGQIGQSAYAASKSGVCGMTLPMAREFANWGIRVLTVAPGLFYTPMLATLPENVQEALGQMTPFPKRLGRPEEFAAMAGHIVENSMLNGEVIRLDGAIRMQPR